MKAEEVGPDAAMQPAARVGGRGLRPADDDDGGNVTALQREAAMRVQSGLTDTLTDT